MHDDHKMTLTNLSLVRRSLRYYWRAGLAVLLGAAAGSAALTGALLVGDSMRASLRDMALARLGPVEHALTGRRFFREALAGEIAADARVAGRIGAICPIILLRAAINHADSDARANRVQILGVDERFWGLYEASVPPPALDDGMGHPSGNSAPHVTQRRIALNAPLAEALGVKIGDDVLLRFEKPSQVPTETLLGRRDDTVATLRLTVDRIIPGHGAGAFSLEQSQLAARNAYVPIDILQQALGQPGRANTLLAVTSDPSSDAADLRDALAVALAAYLRPDDFELRIGINHRHGYLSVESTRLLLEPAIERAVIDSAKQLGTTTVPVLTYLANAITVDRGDASESGDSLPRSIPYSTVTAIDWEQLPRQGVFEFIAGSSEGQAQPVRSVSKVLPEPARSASEGSEIDDILLNEWAARDLDANVGDRITLTYFVSMPGGELEETQAKFRLVGIVRMVGWAGDPDFTPTYEGITDARRVSDWDPPFPFDMKRIRPIDEAYWDDHRALPKAFIRLDAGRRLWGQDHARFGSLTAVRIVKPGGAITDADAAKFSDALTRTVRPVELGLFFEPVREQAMTAGGGSTDFGSLFIGFSSFLIIAAAMLVALLFRLGVERRAVEVGLMQAVGLNVRRVSRLLILEGGMLSVGGTVLGLAMAGGYAWLMLAGLRGWWSAAVNAPFLRLAVTPTSVLIGMFAGVFIALLSILWAVRGLARSTTRSLLSGAVVTPRRGSHPPNELEARARENRPSAMSIGLLLVGILAAFGLSAASLLTEAVPQVAAFFIAGFAMLVALLAALQLWLARTSSEHGVGPVRLTIGALAVRNARRKPTRSLLAAGLVASATFVIVAVGASRKSPDADAAARTGGTGGYSLIAEAAAALPYDPGTAEGRSSLGMGQEVERLCEDATIMAFRLRPGDDSSCLNLYKVRQPRILGAREQFMDRGGFRFSRSMAESDDERANPWTLLNRTFADGAIAAIGDESAVRWLLHLGLGEDLSITDERGNEARLRIVGMLSGSVLQGELIVAEPQFLRLFPSTSGYGVLLIDAPPEQAASMKSVLSKGLGRFGVEISDTRSRLAAYLAVENTYLSTFQALGGLGLLLGTIGLAAVTLRNVWERRGELALLRALGLRASDLFRMTLMEHTAILACGLAVGSISAAFAIAPHLLSSSGDVPLQSLAITIFLVFLIGAAVGAWSIHSTLKAPLLKALRRE